MGKVLEIFCLFLIFSVVLFPMTSHGEAEQIYVLWIDIDYMEPNPMMGWLEDIRDQLADVSPFIGQLLLPEGSFSDLEEGGFTYDDEASNSGS